MCVEAAAKRCLVTKVEVLRLLSGGGAAGQQGKGNHKLLEHDELYGVRD